MKNIRAYKSISQWQKDLKAEGYSVSAGVCASIEQAMKTQTISFADAYMLLVERGIIIPTAPSKQNLGSLLQPAKNRSKRGRINEALNQLADTKSRILSRRVNMGIKDDIHLFFGAMDYFYKTFPYGKDAEIEFAEEMKQFDEFVVYTRKLMDRIGQYERNNKPNRIIVHKYKFPDL